MHMILLAQASSLGENANSLFGMFATPLMVIAAFVALIFLAKRIAKLYAKVPPHEALVIYGGGKLQIVSGGAKLLIPMMYDWYTMDLSQFQVDLALQNAPNKDKVPINVRAIATVCIGDTVELQEAAARKFGNKKRDEIIKAAHATLEGQFRQVISQTDMETILSARAEFSRITQETAGKELAHLGFQLLMLNIQEVTDLNGYIEAQGKPKVAEVKADALIKEADFDRDRIQRTSEADKLGRTTKAANDALIVDAERELTVKRAQAEALTNAEQARAAQAGPLAAAEASKGVRVATVEAEEAETQARIKLQDSVARLTEAQLNATRIKQAEAEVKAVTIEAEGVKSKELIAAEAKGQARNITATAAATAVAKEAEAEAARISTVGAANADMIARTGQAEADATKSRLEAEAAGETAKAGARKAMLLAEAEGKTAEAKAVEAMLLAQASGALKLNEAYGTLSPEARQLFIFKNLLETLPAIITAAGDAGAKIMEPYANAVTASLAAIDNLSVYDAGGNTGDGGALERVAGIGTGQINHLLNQLKGSGLFPLINALAINKLGIDLNAAGSTLLPEATKDAVETKTE
jgi:flotillin